MRHVLLFGLAACSSPRTIADASPFALPKDDGSSAVLWEASVPDWYVPGPTPPDGGPPPALACDQDSGDGGACPLPTSRCAGDRWLQYWSNGACVDGACLWEPHYMYCSWGCDKGACVVQHLTAEAPQ